MKYIKTEKHLCNQKASLHHYKHYVLVKNVIQESNQWLKNVLKCLPLVLGCFPQKLGIMFLQNVVFVGL